EMADVVALDNTFRPERVEVVAGTAIRWENRGRNDHDVVPADDTLAWGVDASGFAPGDEYTLLFDTPGEYPYYCSIHGTKDVGMIGTVVVVAVDRGTP
ncbi:MAG TPA: plastocyanin/azurin family copper-binding protein, partial [Ilumatobacteraceae bacterium]|nr:plastocyanin/azurin family copper-binding protein [Ilumatobacteraceae bacterium]